MEESEGSRQVISPTMNLETLIDHSKDNAPLPHEPFEIRERPIRAINELKSNAGLFSGFLRVDILQLAAARSLR